MSDLDLLLTWKAWENYAFDQAWSPGWLFVPAEEFIDAFLDSWHSASEAAEEPDTCQLCLRRIVVCAVR